MRFFACSKLLDNLLSSAIELLKAMNNKIGMAVLPLDSSECFISWGVLSSIAIEGVKKAAERALKPVSNKQPAKIGPRSRRMW